MPAAKGQFMVSYSGKRITPELEPGDPVQIWSHGGKPQKYGVVLAVCKENRISVQLEDGTTICWHKSKVTYYPDEATIRQRCDLVLASRNDENLRQHLRLPRPCTDERTIGPRKIGADIADYVDRYERKRRGNRQDV